MNFKLLITSLVVSMGLLAAPLYAENKGYVQGFGGVTTEDDYVEYGGTYGGSLGYKVTKDFRLQATGQYIERRVGEKANEDLRREYTESGLLMITGDVVYAPDFGGSVTPFLGVGGGMAHTSHTAKFGDNEASSFNTWDPVVRGFGGVEVKFTDNTSGLVGYQAYRVFYDNDTFTKTLGGLGEDLYQERIGHGPYAGLSVRF